jgi:hypothetical protein
MFQCFWRRRGKSQKERVGTAAVPTLQKGKRETALNPKLEHHPIFSLYIYIVNTNKSKVSKKAHSKINNLQRPQKTLVSQSVP